MSGELLPTLQAAAIRRGLSEYLTTTFNLADRAAQQALDDFLTDPDSGIFAGPYVRTRTPFVPVDAGDTLDITPGPHSPYGHQAQAFARLTSKHLGPGERPAPTLVTTGTGSGKTESFLYPILDHIRRARRAGRSGMSALLLYPMNALALDQAQRLARILTEDRQFAGIRAGFYVGDSGDTVRTQVTAEGLITDREALRAEPPDILLTNYKMLDRLLLRPEDQPLWDESATTLQYLVLDEFHTYDGAQGTDVAMLLRRLGAALKRRWAAEDQTLDAHRHRPLGRITPVATSATLGDGGDPEALLRFAHTVFGEEFDADAVITESRYSVADWSQLTGDPLDTPESDSAIEINGIATRLGVQISYAELDAIDPSAAVEFAQTGGARAGGDGDQGAPDALVARTAATLLTTPDHWEALAPALLEDGELRRHLPELIRHHPSVQRLAEATVHAQPLADLAQQLRTSIDYLNVVIAVLSAVRAAAGRAALTIDVHMWVRELTRIDRVAGGRTAFRWADDAVTDLSAEVAADWADNDHRSGFPAVFCRSCGRSGWAVLLSPTGDGTLDHPERDDTIRAARMLNNTGYRVLLAADGEAEVYATSGSTAAQPHPHLRDFRVLERRITSPDDVFGPSGIEAALEDAVARGEHLPVLVDMSDDGSTAALRDECPACGERDSIRFLGAAIATLLSVSLSTLFGESHLAAEEKKSLVFTDSVQDAAHRAGFVEARSHTFSSRSVLAAAAAEAPTLATIARTAMHQAGDDPAARYRLLAPEFTTGRFAQATRWWQHPEKTQGPEADFVARRLAFDASLEFGLQNRVGRTLELTGTAEAEVELPSREMLIALTENLFDDGAEDSTAPSIPNSPDNPQSTSVAETAGQGVAIMPTEQQRIAWVRAVVEHLRLRGAIHHPWLDTYVREAGRRYRIWGGRPRHQGMPAFPAGRAAPAFAYIGPSLDFDSAFEKVSEPRGWFARYTARALGVDRRHGAELAVELLRALAQHDDAGPGPIRQSAALERRGTAFGLEPSRVRLSAADAPEHLACTVCRTDFPMAARARSEMAGAPCLLVTCSGVLEAQPVAENFYRRLYTGSNPARIIAREHSSMLSSESRAEVENGFKRSGADPGAVNVLVATPTLEMGIDIGELSCVMLASLPRTVASYVQRVGRAGRQTGNALALAFANGRGHERPQLDDPLATIDGAVRPPATYLDAVEIIRRQYIAFLLDILAHDTHRSGGLPDTGSGIPETRHDGDDDHGHSSVGHAGAAGIRSYPRRATAVFRPALTDSRLLMAVIELGESDHERLLTEFLTSFTGHIDIAEKELRAWASPHEDGSGLRHTLAAAHADFTERLAALNRRLREIQPTLEDLKTRDDAGTLAEEDRDDLRQARSAYRATRHAIEALGRSDWVSALETAQLLPNYTLLDDRTELDVITRWADEESGEWKEEQLTFDRGTAVALRDFAPGARFYGRGLQVRIDAVDLGAQNDDIYTLSFCPQCGYTHSSLDMGDSSGHSETTPTAGTAGFGGSGPRTCPRCGSSGIADRGQRVDAVRFRRASAMINRDEAAIADREDERMQRMFTVLSLADIDPTQAEQRWYTSGYDFGVTYLRQVKILTTNLGTQRNAEKLMISGMETSASLFTVCAACGVLDSGRGTNNRWEHRPWCHLRDSPDENTVSVALTHELHTQGALLRLPYELVTADLLMVPSFMAALRLGLREVLGGDPQHISLLETAEPVGESTQAGATGGRGVAQAILLHDTVPGGTGYLADLCQPQKLWEILRAAYTIVRDCQCRGREVACAQCLLPAAPHHMLNQVSRQSAENTLMALLSSGKDDAFGTASEDGSARAARAAGAAVGEVPEEMQWVPTDDPPPAPQPESALEAQLLAVLRPRLTQAGFQVTDVPSPNRFTGLRFSHPQSRLTWRLLPQEIVGYTRPDYLLRCVDPHVPDVAVYTDGYAFHASPQNNIIGDDAEKRASLWRTGMPVISASFRDVQAARSDSPAAAGGGQRTQTGTGHQTHETNGLGTQAGVLGQWYQQTTPEVVQQLRHMPGVSWPDPAPQFLSSPIEVLLAWVRFIDDAAAQTSALGSGMRAGQRSQQFEGSGRADGHETPGSEPEGRPERGGIGRRNPAGDEAHAIRAFAASVPLLLAAGFPGWHRDGVFVTEAPIAEQLSDDLIGRSRLTRYAGQPVPADSRRGILLRRGALAVLVVPPTDSGKERQRTAVVIDDRDATVVTDEFPETWQTWLHLCSLLSFADPTEHLAMTSVTAVEDSRSAASSPALDSDDRTPADESQRRPLDVHLPLGDEAVEISQPWRELLDREELLDDERALAEALARRNLRVLPEIGYEEPHEGWSIDFAWPQLHVAAGFDIDDEMEAALSDYGWTLVSVGADSLAADADAVAAAVTRVQSGHGEQEQEDD